MNTTKFRWKYAIPLALVAAGVYFLFFTKSGHKLRHCDAEQLADFFRSFGIYSVAAGMFAIFLQTWFPFVPFVLIAGANAYVFGLTGGFLINYSMACVSAFAAFMFARYLAYDYVDAKLARYPSVRSFNAKLESNGFLYTLMARLMPVIPSSLVNFGAGVSKMHIRPFMLGTIIGKLPVVVLETLIGHDLLHFREHKGRLFVMVALFLVLILAGNGLKRIWSLRKK